MAGVYSEQEKEAVSESGCRELSQFLSPGQVLCHLEGSTDQEQTDDRV